MVAVVSSGQLRLVDCVASGLSATELRRIHCLSGACARAKAQKRNLACCQRGRVAKGATVAAGHLAADGVGHRCRTFFLIPEECEFHCAHCDDDSGAEALVAVQTSWSG